MRLNTGLQLIIVESIDNDMSHQIIGCQLFIEETEEVMENRLYMLTSQYETFKSNPDKTLTSVFERYT